MKDVWRVKTLIRALIGSVIPPGPLMSMGLQAKGGGAALKGIGQGIAFVLPRFK